MPAEAIIKLEHGSGGALSRELIEDVIHPRFRSPQYGSLEDATAFRIDGEACLTTDTFVVDPPFFPGSDIGRLAVFGTCNDLSVSGAVPRFLSCAMVIEEGFRVADLERALDSIAGAAREAGVVVLTGDTKVVPAGRGGGLFINTTGVGERVFRPAAAGIAAGDRILLSGPIGAHGVAVLAAREGLAVSSAVRSDCAFLHPLCRELYALGENTRFIRDATRGGVAAVLNELVHGSAFGALVRERAVPVSADVAAVSSILGLDPLVVANEGVLAAVVSAEAAERAVRTLCAHERGARAAVIGEIVDAHPGRVMMETRIGGRRVLDFPRGILLPRIC